MIIRGQSIIILDSLANFPLQGVMLQIGEKKLVSDHRGIIRLENTSYKKKGILLLEGYRPKIISMDEVYNGDTIYLSQKINLLKPVIISTQHRKSKKKIKRKGRWKYIFPAQNLVFILRIKDTSLYNYSVEKIKLFLYKKAPQSKQTLTLDFYQIDSDGNLQKLWENVLEINFGKDKYMEIIPKKPLEVDEKTYLFTLKANDNKKVIFYGELGKESENVDLFFHLYKVNSKSDLKNFTNLFITSPQSLGKKFFIHGEIYLN